MAHRITELKEIPQLSKTYGTANIINAIEDTDAQIYNEFVTNTLSLNAKIFQTETFTPYDVKQLTKKNGTITTSIVELKTRYEYTYEKYDTIYLEEYKIQNIINAKKGIKAKKALLSIIYPLSDKIVIIDISNLDIQTLTEEKSNTTPYKGQIFANANTTKSTEEKKLKDVIYFPLRKQETNNITYVYNIDNLQQKYIDTFNENFDFYCGD